MRLVPNVRKNMRAYSIWALMLSLALFLLPEFFYAYVGTELASPYMIGRLALFMGVFGILGWFIDQSVPSLLRTAKIALVSFTISAVIVLLMTLPTRAMGELHSDTPAPVATGLPTWSQTAVYAVPLTARWEGLETTAYLDRIASPPVWTICHGETFNVTPGETRTAVQCTAGLEKGLRRYWAGYRSGLTLDNLAPQTDAAMSSLTWNIGIGGMLRSSALRALNAGDIVDACRRLTFWNKSGGRVVRGLVNRRADEQALCLEGLT